MQTFSRSDVRRLSASWPRRLRRPGALAAAIAAAVLVAGCGTASTTSGSGSAGSSTTATGSEFNPNLVPAGGSAPGKTFPKNKKSAKKGAVKKSSKSSSGSGVGSFASPSAPAPVAPAPKIVTKTRTVRVTHTVTHTVVHTKVVRPHVPAGAGLPSTRHALSVGHFSANGGNVGCAISGGVVRCDVGRRVWSAGRRPKSCHSAWGQGIYVASSGGPHFVCSGGSVLDPGGYHIPNGYDDKVGSVTCQVRAFGVTCFQRDGAGFSISRTGYRMF